MAFTDTTDFSFLANGEYFFYEGDDYIKLESLADGEVNAACLSGKKQGKQAIFKPNTPVNYSYEQPVVYYP